jgi:hypothetical protein
VDKTLFFLLLTPVAGAFFVFGCSAHAWWSTRGDEYYEPEGAMAEFEDEFAADRDWAPGELTEEVAQAPHLETVATPVYAELLPDEAYTEEFEPVERAPERVLTAERRPSADPDFTSEFHVGFDFQVRTEPFEDEFDAALYAIRRQFAAIRDNTDAFLRPALEPA